MLKIGFILSLLVLVIAIYLSRNTMLSDKELTSALKGKVVVICGASSGIGEETAYHYARVGAKLILSARSEDKLLDVKSKCEGAQSVDVIVQDFSKVEEMEEYASKIFAIHPTIDVLLLNHAAMPSKPWLSESKQQAASFIERTFKINVLSFVELTRIFMPVLEKSGGQIHVTSSAAGYMPFFQMGLYCSTKHAMNGFYKSLQQELILKKSPVSVTIFSLGIIGTKEVMSMLNNESNKDEHVPSLFVGDLSETARLMTSCAVTRHEDVDYPWVANKITRTLVTLGLWNKVIAAGKSYEEVVGKSDKMNELRREMQYQVGNSG